MKRWVFLSLLALVFACDKTTIIESNEDDEEQQAQYVYLSLKVTSKKNGQVVGEFVNVSVFNYDTKQRLIRGGTDLHGWFGSTLSIAENQKVKIEIYDQKNRCIGWVQGINYLTDPVWFVLDKNQLRTNDLGLGHFHLGSWSEEYPIVTGNWGP